MPGLLYHVGATAICTHGGQVSVITTNTRVLVSGQPVATFSDTYPVVACPFSTPAGPHPCVKVQWLVPAGRVFVNGQPVILQTSAGVCQSADQLPQGTPTIVATQTRVAGT